MKNELFLDTSIVISILTQDLFLPQIAKEIAKYDSLWISSMSYLFAFNKARKLGLNSSEIYQELDYYKVSTVDSDTIKKAQEICLDTDFEDALQVASALDIGVVDFLTHDQRQAKRYKNWLKIRLLQIDKQNY